MNNTFILIGMQYACHTVTEAIDKLSKALEFNVDSFKELTEALGYEMMCHKVLHPWGRGISLRRLEQK